MGIGVQPPSRPRPFQGIPGLPTRRQPRGYLPTRSSKGHPRFSGRRVAPRVRAAGGHAGRGLRFAAASAGAGAGDSGHRRALGGPRGKESARAGAGKRARSPRPSFPAEGRTVGATNRLAWPCPAARGNPGAGRGGGPAGHAAPTRLRPLRAPRAPRLSGDTLLFSSGSREGSEGSSKKNPLVGLSVSPPPRLSKPHWHQRCPARLALGPRNARASTQEQGAPAAASSAFGESLPLSLPRQEILHLSPPAQSGTEGSLPMPSSTSPSWAPPVTGISLASSTDTSRRKKLSSPYLDEETEQYTFEVAPTPLC